MEIKQNKIWIPKEIKQKEIIWFHVPIIKRPITNRHVFFLLPSLILSVVFFIGSFAILPIEKNGISDTINKNNEIIEELRIQENNIIEEIRRLRSESEYDSDISSIKGLEVRLNEIRNKIQIAESNIDEPELDTSYALSITMRVMIALFFPILAIVISQHKRDGVYLDEKIKIKLKHKLQSNVILNEKALVALERSRRYV